jgi:hypothetical protein
VGRGGADRPVRQLREWTGHRRHAPEPKSGDDPKAVWGDDCIEVLFRPEFGAQYEYSFVGNARGVKEEGRREVNTDKSFACEWDFRARRTDNGWEGEMRIPFASLGVRAPKPGEVWEMAPVNNQKTPRAEISSWPHLKKWLAREDFGYLVFGGEAPAVRVARAGELSATEVGMDLELSNFTAAEALIEIRLALFQPVNHRSPYFQILDAAANPLGPQAEATEWVDAATVARDVLRQFTRVKDQAEMIRVAANETRRLVFAHPSARGNYVLHYEVRDARRGVILAAGPLPFFRRSPLELLITPYVLSAGTVEVVADHGPVSGVAAGDRVRVDLLDRERTKVFQVVRGEVHETARRIALDVPVADLEPGVYTVRCSITGPDGAARAERDEVFTLPAKPAWWDNKLGYPEWRDVVPEPWTPMVRKPKGFEVWNRKIYLDAALQPSQIFNGRAEMLTGPARLDLQLDGLTWGEPETVTNRNTRIVQRQSLRARNVTGELLLEAEFDGFMKYTLRLEPRGAASLDRLVLEVPLKAELATHYHHGPLGTPAGYAELKVHKGYGAVPKEGLALPFTSTIWLGNDDVGFNWVAESDQWWTSNDAKQAVTVRRQDGATVLRVNFVERPSPLREPVKFEWAILATPVKPMNEELLRQLRFAQSGWGLDKSLTKLSDDTGPFIEAMVEGGVNAFNQWCWEGATSLWNEDFSAPGYRPTPLNEVRKRAFRQATDLAYQKGIRWVTAYAIWQCFRDWPDVGELWREQALMPLAPAFKGYLYCSARPFADWHIATLRRTIAETGINGVYLDSSPDPRLCAHRHHGHGYVDAEGKLHGTYPVFACREFHKRIYSLFHGEATKGGLVYAHNSHFPFIAVESFVDVHHCGEGSQLTRDVAIPKFYGRPFGLPVSFTRWNSPVYPETRMHSWRFVLQVDGTIKAHPSMVISRNLYPAVKGGGREALLQGYEAQSEAVWQVWRAYREFPWDGAQWLPSWKVEPYARTGDADLWACMHLNPGRAALVVVSSFRNEPATAKVQLDWKRMGFDPNRVTISDCITFEPIQPEDDGVTLPVLENRWRMLSIRAMP